MNTFTVVIYKVISPVDEHKPSFHTTTQTKDQMKIAHKDREKSALQSMHQYLRLSTKFRPHPIDFLGSESTNAAYLSNAGADQFNGPIFCLLSMLVA
jgi:hypothetical protein